MSDNRGSTRQIQAANRLRLVRDRIQRAAEDAGRPADSVRLVAVSKTAPAADVVALILAGQTEFGENRVQEGVAKIAEIQSLLGKSPTWRMIGHLQRNKASVAVEHFHSIDSVDSFRLWDALAKEAEAQNRPVSVLAQFNCSGEDSKGGFDADDLEELARRAAESPLQLRGLMTIGPLHGGPEAAKLPFVVLAVLRERLQQMLGRALPELSMGMSADLEVGIACGATMVRVGTALFGPRSAPTIT